MFPNQALVYKGLSEDGGFEMPWSFRSRATGCGRRSTASSPSGDDLNTIRGFTYYEHGETPGLGGEVDNPRWKALWPGRKAFDEPRQSRDHRGDQGRRRSAGVEAPHQVDGLSGATITSPRRHLHDALLARC